MYEPETVLTLKEPRSTEEKPFPYDRVQVIGQSPINHGTIAEEWTGASGQGVIITPLTDFGSTLDEPYGKLQQMYEVESIPVREALAAVPVRVITPGTAGPTPEDTFAAEAPGVAPEPGQKRGRTARSPLDGEESVPPSSSPLGDAEQPQQTE